MSAKSTIATVTAGAVLWAGVAVSAAADELPGPVEIAPGVTQEVLSVDDHGAPTSGRVTIDTEIAPEGDLSGYVERNREGATLFGMPGSTTENVGGGTWQYGWNLVNFTEKHCFSHYMHRTKNHGATVTMGGRTNNSTQPGGKWAKATLTGGVTSGTCHSYWNAG